MDAVDVIDAGSVVGFFYVLLAAMVAVLMAVMRWAGEPVRRPKG